MEMFQAEETESLLGEKSVSACSYAFRVVLEFLL